MPPKPTLASQKAFVEKAGAAVAKSAGRTPSRVLKTFYPATIKICGVEVSRCGLGILGLLEQIEHPFVAALMGQPDRAVTIQDQQRAFFIFAKPRDARDILATGGTAALDKAVFDFCEPLDAGALSEITAKVVQLVREGLSTIPGVDLDAKPEGEASGPLAPAVSGSPSETPA